MAEADCAVGSNSHFGELSVGPELVEGQIGFDKLSLNGIFWRSKAILRIAARLLSGLK